MDVLRLECLIDVASRMRHATEVLNALEHAPGDVAICHYRPLMTGQEALGMFMAATEPILEQHNWLLAVYRRTVDPLIGLVLRAPPGFLKHLHRGFMAVNHRQASRTWRKAWYSGANSRPP